MRRSLAATVLALGLSMTAEVQAQWIYQGTESAFGGLDLHVAATGSGAYGFGLRCRGDVIEAIYMTPDTSFERSTYAVANLTKPKLRVRVDDSAIINLDGELIDIDGKATMLAEIDLDLVHAVRDAKSRVAVVLQLMNENFHENSFGVRGSTAATNRMLTGCNLAETNGSTNVRDTLDFAFLVQQEIVAFQCPGHEGDDPFAIAAAIEAEGNRLGWSADTTRTETLGRREHQLDSLRANPDVYCAKADELKDANGQRLKTLLTRN